MADSKIQEAARLKYPQVIGKRVQAGDLNEIPRQAFIAGAEWQEEQMEKNRLVHCDSLTKEEYDIETAFADEIIEKENRTPTFIDAIKYGMKLQKEQMMTNEEMKCALRMEYEKGVFDTKQQMLKEAVDGYVNYYEDSGGILMAEAQIGCPYHNGDKVKIIIVKEDKE